MRFHISTVFLSCLLAITAPALAGTVAVSFLHPQRYSDAGADSVDKDRNLQTLAKHLESLGERHLPPGHVLKLEVLNVDLAGNLKHVYRSGRDVRVMNGRVDWPLIHLRYTLDAGGALLRSGEETVADMNYLGHSRLVRDGSPLPYEKYMLDEWFRARWVEGR